MSEAKMQRIAMNSKSLQEHFPQVYRDFFSKCPIAVSAPGSFIWSGEYASIFGGFSITQLLPCRVYVGIEPRSTTEMANGLYLVFNPSLGKFESHPYDPLIRAEIFKLLKVEIKKIAIKSKYQGFVLHILSEVPTERGLNTSGAISAALATALHLTYQKNSKPEEIKKWLSLSLSDLTRNHLFDQIFRLAWKIESIYHAGVTSGRGAFVPFVHSAYPVIYFMINQSPSWGSEPKKIFEAIDKSKYWGFRLNEFFDFEVPSYHWPIDFGLIYSGYENSTASIIRMIPNIQEDFMEVAGKIKEKIHQKITDPKDREACRFYDHGGKEAAWEKIIEALGIISLKIASSLETLLRKGYSEEHLQEFFKSLNQYQNILHILEASTTSIDHICFSVFERGRKLDIVSGVGAKLTGAGHGGDVVFAAPIGIFRKSVEELINELRTFYNKEISLDYASWIDGYEEEGIKVEQCLEGKIYSSFVSRGIAKVIHLNKQGNLHTDLYTLEEYKNLKKEADLLLDNINNEIYVKGQHLTSKEIHSASKTIDIVQFLLNHVGKEIKNSDFPESSYTRDRNELQGKVIGPLIKIVNRKIGYKLNLKINGGIVDFWVKLEPGNLDIYLLEEIF